MRLVVRAAGLKDLPAVYKVLYEAGAWLNQRGIHQWPTPYSRESRLTRGVDSFKRLGHAVRRCQRRRTSSTCCAGLLFG